MPMYHKPFECEVLTLAGSVFKAEAVSASFPAVDGMVGVLADHAPLIAGLGAGALLVEAPDGNRRQLFIAGGFARVQENVLSILADQCLPIEDIRLDGAKAELDQARSMPDDTPEKAQRRKNALEIATAKVRIAQRQQHPGS